jgi:putative dimethyl sulfoxide reductase chaperone
LILRDLSGFVLADQMMQDIIMVYRLLAQALTYPDKDFIANLKMTVGQINLELFDEGGLPLRGFVHELSTLAQIPLDQIQGEHTRLFINAFPHVVCPPYESAYREGALMGDAAMQVAEEYHAWGLVIENEQVDHLGAELEFVAFLLTLDTPKARATVDKFMTIHLSSWLPQFATDLARESRLEFYRQVGNLLLELGSSKAMKPEMLTLL